MPSEAASDLLRPESMLDDGTVVVPVAPAVLGHDPVVPPALVGAVAVVVDDPGRSVTKTHLAVGAGADDVMVQDLHSANGTSVELDSVTTAWVPGAWVVVPAGATLSFGSLTARVESEPLVTSIAPDVAALDVPTPPPAPLASPAAGDITGLAVLVRDAPAPVPDAVVAPVPAAVSVGAPPAVPTWTPPPSSISSNVGEGARPRGHPGLGGRPWVHSRGDVMTAGGAVPPTGARPATERSW